MSIHDCQVDGTEGVTIATVDTTHSPPADGGILIILWKKTQFSPV